MDSVFSRLDSACFRLHLKICSGFCKIEIWKLCATEISFEVIDIIMYTNTAHKQTKIVMTHLAGLCFFLFFISNKMFSRRRMFPSPKFKTPSVLQNQ